MTSRDCLVDRGPTQDASAKCGSGMLPDAKRNATLMLSPSSSKAEAVRLLLIGNVGSIMRCYRKLVGRLGCKMLLGVDERE